MEGVKIDVSLIAAAANYMAERGSELSDLMVGGCVEFNAEEERIVFIDADDVEVGSVGY